MKKLIIKKIQIAPSPDLCYLFHTHLFQNKNPPAYHICNRPNTSLIGKPFHFSSLLVLEKLHSIHTPHHFLTKKMSQVLSLHRICHCCAQCLQTPSKTKEKRLIFRNLSYCYTARAPFHVSFQVNFFNVLGTFKCAAF